MKFLSIIKFVKTPFFNNTRLLFVIFNLWILYIKCGIMIVMGFNKKPKKAYQYSVFICYCEWPRHNHATKSDLSSSIWLAYFLVHWIQAFNTNLIHIISVVLLLYILASIKRCWRSIDRHLLIFISKHNIVQWSPVVVSIDDLGNLVFVEVYLIVCVILIASTCYYGNQLLLVFSHIKTSNVYKVILNLYPLYCNITYVT